MTMDDTVVDAKLAAQKKKKRKRTVNLILLGVVVLALAVGGYLLYQYLTKSTDTSSETTYRVANVEEGEISSVISGSGTLTAKESSSIVAAADCTVEKLYKQSGDAVTAGETVMTLKSDTITDELTTAREELQSVREDIAGTTQLRTSSELLITPGKRGVVKDLQIAEGDIVDDLDYLCLISTDGCMKVEIPSVDGMRQYDAVTVQIGEASEDGYVYGIADGIATVVIDENSYDMNAAATVYGSDGTKLGEGTLTVNEFIKVTASAGQIEAIYIEENESVGASRKLFKLKKGAPTEDYVALKKEEQTLLKEVADLEDELTIKAEWDGIVTTISVSEGEEVASGGALCDLAGSDGYVLTLSIDELDIASIKHGQNATVTLDALSDQEFIGTVTNISFAGSGSYVTSYSATVETETIEGAYPGMSASAEIITETSGTGMIVSVNAVQYDGDQAFVYLAGDEQRGTRKSASELDLDSLTKANVTTGMSDGSNLVVESDSLSVGDAIWVPQLATTATYSSSDSSTTTSFSGMGGMSGGFPGGDMGGGFPGGNMGGGNMGGGMRPNN